MLLRANNPSFLRVHLGSLLNKHQQNKVEARSLLCCGSCVNVVCNYSPCNKSINLPNKVKHGNCSGHPVVKYHSSNVYVRSKFSTSTIKLSTVASLPPQPAQPVPSNEQNGKEIDDLKAMLKDNSIGVGQKLKILFAQYGKVLLGVWMVTSTFWFGSIYFLLSRLVKTQFKYILLKVFIFTGASRPEI